MVVRQIGTWRALLLLPPLLVALPLATVAQPRAQQPAPPNTVQYYPLRHYQLQFRPDLDQLADYDAAIECWERARAEQRPDYKRKWYDCVERHLLGALDGPSSFPEATLALAHFYYTRNSQEGRMQPDAYRASYVFSYVAGKVPLFKHEMPITGALKSEALTYLGILDLRGRRWSLAKQNFEEAMRIAADEARRDAAHDISGETLSLTTRGEYGKMVAGWRYRLRPLECVNRVGSVMATFYMALNPADPAPGTPQYTAVLNEVNRLLPADVIARCESVFNGDLAAIWRFPERLPPPGSRPLPFKPYTLAYPDWTLTLTGPRPEGVEQVSIAEFVRAIRIWAGAELAPNSPEPPMPAAGLGHREQYNQGARLLRDMLDREAKGQYQEALRIADLLDQLPEVRFDLWRDGPEVSMPVVARQHRIWIRLDYLRDLAEARRLIYGPNAAPDPDLFHEHFTLAERYLAAKDMAGAEAEFRFVLNGSPQATEPRARAWQQQTLDVLKPLAAWNLAVMSLNLPPANDNPDVWLEMLRNLPNQSFPAAQYRDVLRFFGELRLAEAYVRKNMPQQAEEAIRAAEGMSGVVGAEDWLDVYRRHLAELIFSRGQEGMYQGGFLTKTSYGAELRAYEAQELYRALIQRNPQPSDTDYQPILDKLLEAQKWVNGNQQLRGNLDIDIAAIREYQTRYPAWKKAMDERALLMPLVAEWNDAADATADAARMRLSPQTSAQAVMAWKNAVDRWTALVPKVQGLPAGLEIPMYGSRTGQGTDLQEASRNVVAANLGLASAYVVGGDQAGARAALDAAEAALSLPLRDEDKALYRIRIERNRRALGRPPAARTGAWPGSVHGVRGGPLRAVGNAYALTKYPKRHKADVNAWLARLRSDANARRKLVDWCNNGPVARAAARRGLPVKRDFTADLEGPNSLVAFLERNVSRTPGLLRKGTTQWSIRPGTNRWVSSPVRVNEAAIMLKNGVQFVNASCTNPINAIVQGPVPPTVWVFYPTYVTYRHEPLEIPPLYPPVIQYSRPEAVLPTIFFGTYGYAWAVWIPTSVIIPPKFVVLVRTQPLPTLIMPRWHSIPPLCSPRRVTIGRISSIDDAFYPLHVDSGTAENPRRRGGSPRGAAEPTRKFPFIIPPGPDFNPYYYSPEYGQPYGPPYVGPGGSGRHPRRHPRRR